MAAQVAIKSEKAPPAAGPYSSAIKANGLVFCSGQLPVDSKGNLIEGDIKLKTTQCLNNIESVLKAGKSDLSKVVKFNIYLKDMNDFAAVNEAYQKKIEEVCKEKPMPARSCVEVARLPKDVKVEIECIALA